LSGSACGFKSRGRKSRKSDETGNKECVQEYYKGEKEDLKGAVLEIVRNCFILEYNASPRIDKEELFHKKKRVQKGYLYLFDQLPIRLEK